MKELTNLLYENDEGIGIITINRPQALNALNRLTIEELDWLLDQIALDRSVKAVIVTGSGEKAFVAGADISEMQSMSALDGREWACLGQRVFRKIENLPQPVIAAVNGFALGGGCELAMACDIRIVCNKAKFGQPEVNLGLCPGFGGTQRLPRLVGKGIALELLFTGDMIDAAEAYRIGLVNKLVPAGELMRTAKDLARKIIFKSLIGVQMCKNAVNIGIEINLCSAMAYEAEVFGLCFSSADPKEGMAAFLEKRKPLFCGR